MWTNFETLHDLKHVNVMFSICNSYLIINFEIINITCWSCMHQRKIREQLKVFWVEMAGAE